MSEKNQKGFTLIEVLMALVIFSVAILGLMQAGTENIRATHSLRQKQIASIIADNQLILAQSSGRPIQKGAKQDVSRMDGQDWDWAITTSATSQLGFYKLVITVREKNSEHVLITRTAFANTPPKAIR